MKETSEITARDWDDQRSVIARQNTRAVLAIAAWLVAGAGLASAQAASENLPSLDGSIITGDISAAPALDTNSPVASIAADLQRLKARIDGAVAAMTNAVASSPALHAAKVTKLADEITELATKDLGDEGQIVRQATALVAKFNDSVAKARKGSSDPNAGPSTREIYGQLLPGLEGELGKLIDAKSTVARIRSELLRQAEGLRQSAEAIGFAEHCGTLVIASQAFRATLTEVTKFTEQIALMIQSVGKSTAMPVT